MGDLDCASGGYCWLPVVGSDRRAERRACPRPRGDLNRPSVGQGDLLGQMQSRPEPSRARRFGEALPSHDVKGLGTEGEVAPG